MGYGGGPMRAILALALFFAAVAGSQAQIQVELKFKRLQYVAYEPVIATVQITNLAGRDIDLQDKDGQRWFSFEVSGAESRLIPPGTQEEDPPLHIESGKTVTRKIN